MSITTRPEFSIYVVTKRGKPWSEARRAAFNMRQQPDHIQAHAQGVS